VRRSTTSPLSEQRGVLATGVADNDLEAPPEHHRRPGQAKEALVRELLLVRHGESVGNVAAALAEQSGAEMVDVPARDADVELSPTGVAQSEAFGVALGALADDQRPHAAWCSPYRRAAQSLDIALTTAALPLPVRVDERLRDKELGVLDRLTVRGMAARHPEEVERRRWLGKFYHRPTAGESWADLALRVRSALSDIERIDDERVLVMCHDAVILVFRYVCEQLTESEVLHIARENPVRNLSVTVLTRDDASRTWQATAYNDVSHLEQAGIPVIHHPEAHDVRPRRS
jgi:broad specificity phosphatase PhoE